MIECDDNDDVTYFNGALLTLSEYYGNSASLWFMFIVFDGLGD